MEAHKAQSTWPQGIQGRVPSVRRQSTQPRTVPVHQLVRVLRLAECLGVCALMVGGALQMFSFTKWLLGDRLFFVNHMTSLIVSGFAIVAGIQLFVTSAYAAATLFGDEDPQVT